MRTRTIVLVSIAAAGLGITAAAVWRGRTADEAVTVAVARGTLAVQVTVAGSLRPAQSLAYRSPLGAREAEIIFLAAEGTRVGEGDLIARLDTTDLERDLERARQELRQAQVELQAAEIDWQTAQGAVDALSGSEGALTMSEAQTRLQASEKKVERLRAEVSANKPLLDKGFMTREEFNRAADALEQAEADLALERQRASILSDQTRPREEQRAKLTAAQKAAQRENVRARVQEIEARGRLLADQIEACSLHARQPGLIVYETYSGASPRRKVRIGDRVTGSQSIITIPEVGRMLVDASATEADVHRFQPGQPAVIHLEAFPDARLTGKVLRVGTLATDVADQPPDEKRFELVIEVDPCAVDLRPGMTARADVILGTRRDVLLVPVGAVFDRNGVTVCEVQTGWPRPEARPVQLGESSGGFVIVLRGLTQGERVVLADSASAAADAPVRTAMPAQQMIREGKPGGGDPPSPR